MSEEDEQDWEMAPDSDAEFTPDPERVEFLREIAEDVRRDSSESKQLSAILYRVSDLYDEEGDTSPEEIYLNVRHIMAAPVHHRAPGVARVRPVSPGSARVLLVAL